MIRLRVGPLGSRNLVRSGRSLAALIAVAAIAASIPAASASTSLSLLPSADTWVNYQVATANYGAGTVLRIDGSPRRDAYVRFDLSGIYGTVTSAVLKLYPNSDNRAGLSVHSVVAAAWVDGAITAATAPAMGTASISSGPLTAHSVVSIDITKLVGGLGSFTVGLTDKNTTAVSLASRESAHPPVLTLTIANATPTPVATSVATLQPSATSSPAPTVIATPAATTRPSATPSATPAATPTVAPSSPPTSANPVRATFYYPWFPEAWKQSGMNPYTHYHPSAGLYDESSPAVVAAQIAAMQYGKITVGIASWWGQGSRTDARIPLLLSTAAGTGFKWSIYYEAEGSSDPSVAQISSDLAYINSHYGSNPSFYRINGRPVIFVYAQPTDACGMATRWAQANASHADYVILKVFPGFAGCASQPDQWHQYSPAVAEDHQAGRSFSISPGFWLATSSVRLARNTARWQQEVHDMVASGEPWQLVTTFNEWGEGTAVESATEWASSSGYGTYLDALHNS
jgi:hypothetical protein